MTDSLHPALSIDDFEQSRVDGGSFDHEAHVYMAWLYLGQYPLTEAIDRFTSALKRLTLELGVPGKYHDTITWFFMLIIAQRRIGNVSADWQNFKEKKPGSSLARRQHPESLLQQGNARQRRGATIVCITGQTGSLTR